jgi:tRNA-dihydrouridine synthase
MALKKSTAFEKIFPELNFPVQLAPMVGLSHVAFRMLLREYLPQGARTLWPTEMLSSKKLPIENLNTTPETLKGIGEDFIIPQILGNEEKSIALSVQKLVEWGASGIDINMGCPVQKALRHNYGVALMGDINYAAEVVRMTVKHSPLPVSVKIRGGDSVSDSADSSNVFLNQFVSRLVDAGASWICLHPRTAEQKRRGSADWSQIQYLKKTFAIPIIGNGDIQTANDVLQMFTQTDCDMVMVGRALTARPWLLWQIGELMGMAAPIGREGERAPSHPLEEGAEYGRSLLRLMDHLEFYFSQKFSENLALRKFRFHIKTGAVWLPFGHTLVSLSTKHKTFADIRTALQDFFSQPIEMSERTDLRQ